MAVTAAELLEEWKVSMKAREDMVRKHNEGLISKVDIIENDLARIQWFLGKLLLANVLAGDDGK